MSEQSNFYELLGLSRDATPEEIRRSYHEAARHLHPDVNEEPGATELFLLTQQAYEVLSDPTKRAKYDASLPPEPLPPIPIFLNTLISRTKLPRVQEPQLVYALLEFEPPIRPASETARSTSPPLNISLVIDRSTSMLGERMDTVKTAAIELVRQLRPDDIFSIIVFSDRAEVLLPAGNDANLKNIEAQIRMIRPGGGTEILRGLEAAFFEVRRNLSKSQINHIILLTDGRTYGDEEDCLHLADKAAAHGVRISGLGIGNDWNDSFLDDLAGRTGGSSTYVAKPSSIENYLNEKLQELSKVYAEQVILDLKTGSGVELNYAYRLQPEPAPLPSSFPLRLGSIPRDSSLSVILEFMVMPVPEKIHRVKFASGRINLHIPSAPESNAEMRLDLNRPVGKVPLEEYPPRPIIKAMSQVILYRMQERARQQVAQGDVTGASRRLQHLATHLLSQGRDDLARTILMEANHIQHTHEFSQEGGKRIKYETRSLLPPPGLQE